jgi:glycosyltransferase involved in cell wall biosynthesis
MQDKIKILFILPLPPPLHGSSVIASQIRSSEIINKEFDCDYINLSSSRKVNEIGQIRAIKFLRFLKMLVQIIFRLYNNKYSIIYFAICPSGKGFFRDASIIAIIKLFNKNFLIHMHGKGVSQRQNKYLDNLLYRFVFRDSDVILLSKLLYPDIQKYVPQERIHYCPNGIPDINTIGKYKIKVPDGPVQILFISNLLKSKGVDVLLEAAKMLQSKNLNFHCTFVGEVGDINEQEFNSKVYHLEIESSITYTGKKYGAEKMYELSKADIFVFPTLNEAFGLVNLEAMQFNLPVISTFEGGIPDVIENGVTGFLIPSGKVEALAEKLEVLIKDKALRLGFGKAGRLRYEKYFTLQHFEKNFIDILNSVIKLYSGKIS